MGVGGQRHDPSALPPGMTRYPLYKRLGGPQDRSGRMRKISPPPGFDPRTVQLVASRCTDFRIRTAVTPVMCQEECLTVYCTCYSHEKNASSVRLMFRKTNCALIQRYCDLGLATCILNELVHRTDVQECSRKTKLKRILAQSEHRWMLSMTQILTVVRKVIGFI
jgi:hypothetical protein